MQKYTRAAVGMVLFGCAVLILACSGRAGAQSSPLMAAAHNCENEALAADTRLKYCEILVNDAGATAHWKGIFYTMRGDAYMAKAVIRQTAQGTAMSKPVLELALQDFATAIQLFPKLPNAYHNRGVVEGYLGNPKLEVADYEAAGMLRLGEGNCKKAVDEFGAALSVDPHRAASLYGRGLCETRTSGKAAGQKDMSAALALDSKVAEQFSPFE